MSNDARDSLAPLVETSIGMLNDAYPEWVTGIDLSQFDIEDFSYCVIGQVGSLYNEDYNDMIDDVTQGQDHAFDIYAAFPDGEYGDDEWGSTERKYQEQPYWDALSDLWKERISQLQSK